MSATGIITEPLQVFADEYLSSCIQHTPEWQAVVESNRLLYAAVEALLNGIDVLRLPAETACARQALAKARGEQ